MRPLLHEEKKMDRTEYIKKLDEVRKRHWLFVFVTK